ncbi:hypothetical protein [Promicromonospora sp. NPDC050880]|uniref:hypothetical protein n=1 Tax=Promicromonospora sp. NPDC050880 TaxID=3364406 RepID=UPI0037AF9D3A
MTHGALIALCENRINGLSRTRLAFEQGMGPERVGRLVDDLREAASGWDAVVFRPPEGDPVALRVGARSVREGVAGFAVVADVLETYAMALEAGQVRHASGLAHLRSARRGAAGLPAIGSPGTGPDTARPDGGAGADPAAATPGRDATRDDAVPGAVEATARAAIDVLDLACAGYAACQDAYQAVHDAERALYAALAHVRVRSSGRWGGLRV